MVLHIRKKTALNAVNLLVYFKLLEYGVICIITNMPWYCPGKTATHFW